MVSLLGTCQAAIVVPFCFGDLPEAGTRSGGGFAACARCEFGGVFIKMGLSVCSPSACCLLVLQPRWRIVLQPGWRRELSGCRVHGEDSIWERAGMPALVVQLGVLQNRSLETVKTAGLVACREPVSSLVQGRQSKNTSLFASSWS